MSTARLLLWPGLVLSVFLTACGTMPLPPEPLAETPPPVSRAPLRKGQAGGVFSPDAVWTLTADHRPFKAGDVLTVLLNETTQASKKADTQFGKNTSATIAPTVIGSNSLNTSVGLSAKRDFNGAATSTQQNALQGAVTVVVQEVLPNGLLHVRGDKSLTLNQGEEIIRLTGYVQPIDVDTDNRVSSLRIANARISYTGTGTLAEANTAGWLTRFFNSPWMPF